MLIIPYHPDRLRPETARWGVLHGAKFSPVDYSPAAYWSLLYGLWARRDVSLPLFIVEHDIVPLPGIYEDMTSCPRGWCTSPYPIRADGHCTTNSLGCVKFSGEFQYATPDLMEVVGPAGAESQAGALWSRLDGAISHALARRGFEPHVHGRSVHLHNYHDPATPWSDPYGGHNGTR